MVNLKIHKLETNLHPKLLTNNYDSSLNHAFQELCSHELFMLDSCNELRLSIYIIRINGKLEYIKGKPKRRALQLQTKFTICMSEAILQSSL